MRQPIPGWNASAEAHQAMFTPIRTRRTFEEAVAQIAEAVRVGIRRVPDFLLPRQERRAPGPHDPGAREVGVAEQTSSSALTGSPGR